MAQDFRKRIQVRLPELPEDQLPYTYEEAQRFIASMLRLAPGEPNEWFQFAVCLAGDVRLIGDCGLRAQVDPPDCAQLGYTFAREH